MVAWFAVILSAADGKMSTSPDGDAEQPANTISAKRDRLTSDSNPSLIRVLSVVGRTRQDPQLGLADLAGVQLAIHVVVGAVERGAARVDTGRAVEPGVVAVPRQVVEL